MKSKGSVKEKELKSMNFCRSVKDVNPVTWSLNKGDLLRVDKGLSARFK